MKLTRTNKILLTLGSVGVAATIAGAGTWATFTDTDTATQGVTAGTVAVSLNGAVGDADAVLTSIGNVAPGDTVGREITLTNTGSLALQSVELDSVALSGAGASGSELFTDEANGLQLSIHDCDNAWAFDATDKAWECDNVAAGTANDVLAQADAVDATGVLTDVKPAANGGSDNLLALFAVPQDLGDDAQGDTGTLTLTFTATQRDATNS